MKGQQKTTTNQLNIPLSNLNTGANDQTNNLPAISDLLGSLVKKRRLDWPAEDKEEVKGEKQEETGQVKEEKVEKEEDLVEEK